MPIFKMQNFFLTFADNPVWDLTTVMKMRSFSFYFVALRIINFIPDQETMLT
jgi:hypothetical protein